MHEFTGNVKAVGEDCPQETPEKRFEAVLRQTGRKGIENVLAELRALGFFSAPASARFHGNYPGGLLEHSLNVYDEAMLVRDAQLGLKSDIAARLPGKCPLLAVLKAADGLASHVLGT